ncbi:MAG: c-type cytochrome domain-containing protein [Pseudobdellovibrionaceae bacterium]
MSLKSLAFVSIFFLLACNSYKSKVNGEPQEDITPASINYAFVNAKVFQPKCFKCHSLAGGNKGDVNLETYENVLAKLGDIQNEVFVEGSMPPAEAGGPLGEYEKNVLKMWIDAGTPRTAGEGPAPLPAPSPAPKPTDPVTPPVNDPEVIGANWNEISKKVFEPKCIKCHQAGEKAEDFPLTDKDWVSNPANEMIKPGEPDKSPLYVAITRRDRKVMPPPKTGMTLSTQEKDAIKNWILNGAKD